MSYRRGSDAEYRVKKLLEGKGYIVMRSAGSHGKYDLIALHPENKVIKLLQIKYGTKKYLNSVDDSFYLLPGVDGLYTLVQQLVRISPYQPIDLD